MEKVVADLQLRKWKIYAIAFISLSSKQRKLSEFELFAPDKKFSYLPSQIESVDIF